MHTLFNIFKRLAIILNNLPGEHLLSTLGVCSTVEDVQDCGGIYHHLYRGIGYHQNCGG